MTTALPTGAIPGAWCAPLTMLVSRLTTPLLPSDYLDVIDPLLSGSPLRGRIVAIHPETRDAATVVIRPGRGWSGHIPGQYLRLGVDIDGVRHWRSYSLTSRTTSRDVSVTVKAIPGGLVSNYLVRRATAGMVVHLDQAAGDFTLGPTPPAKILFVTAGSGVTPVMGMLRNMTAAEDWKDAPDIVVVHSAPSADDVIFGGELRMLARRGRIRLTEIHTASDGMLDTTTLDTLVDDIAERQTWACGPAGFLDSLENHWAALEITDQLHTERFRPAVMTLVGDGGSVRFSTTGVTVAAHGSQSLLDAGESAGVLMPSGCRMGICFGCVSPLRRGAVRDLRNGELTTAVEGDGVLIQTCISAAAGDCELDL